MEVKIYRKRRLIYRVTRSKKFAREKKREKKKKKSLRRNIKENSNKLDDEQLR